MRPIRSMTTAHTKEMVFGTCLPKVFAFGFCLTLKKGGKTVRNYVKAEFYKLSRRKYPWVVLGVALFLESLLMLGFLLIGSSRIVFYDGMTNLLPLLALGLLACMTMCLILVWSNIERIDTTYFINIAQNKLQERKALRAKLEVERERLLSPYELRRKAEEIGMKEPKPGQVRRMEAH